MTLMHMWNIRRDPATHPTIPAPATASPSSRQLPRIQLHPCRANWASCCCALALAGELCADNLPRLRAGKAVCKLFRIPNLGNAMNRPTQPMLPKQQATDAHKAASYCVTLTVAGPEGQGILAKLAATVVTSIPIMSHTAARCEVSNRRT
jgi:hypothetical protein